MKKIVSFIILVLSVYTSVAQKMVPQIKNGTVLSYTAYARAFGQSLPAVLTITDLNAPLKIKWMISGLGTGTFEISAKAVQSGNKMALREPGFNEVTKLKDNETLAFLSKDTFNNLKDKKNFELNGLTFKVEESAPAYQLDGKEVDTFYAVSEKGKAKIWVLNNPDFPLICKIEGTAQGIDLSLNSIQ
ncbi:hypothetical protein [Mucilaginibacter sp. CSA2-8R]|uniref:hypothetical protein n=1 Tax=Mucilaginibacter sp. CSA2-8R TaxID=3141542 RepID=UPI00315D073A